MFNRIFKRLECGFERLLRIDNKKGEEYLWVGDGKCPKIDDDNE